ncbi:MAG TPA: hypothetical protein VMW49_00110, partial [Candidatus Dormibacteraeota bacterium]|nr:hypothetical protein [Candidatus Dormibacteraeota bacterium]
PAGAGPRVLTRRVNVGYVPGAPALVVALLLVAAAVVTLLLVRRRGPGPAGPGGGPLSPGRLAYELTLGVGMLVVGGLLLLAAAWLCVIALVEVSFPGGSWVLPLIPALLSGLVGMALALEGRRRLLRF